MSCVMSSSGSTLTTGTPPEADSASAEGTQNTLSWEDLQFHHSGAAMHQELRAISSSSSSYDLPTTSPLFSIVVPGTLVLFVFVARQPKHSLSLLQVPQCPHRGLLIVVTMEQSLSSDDCAALCVVSLCSPKFYYHKIASLLYALLLGLLTHARLYVASCLGRSLVSMYCCLPYGHGEPLCVAGCMLCMCTIVLLVDGGAGSPLCWWLMVVQTRC